MIFPQKHPRLFHTKGPGKLSCQCRRTLQMFLQRLYPPVIQMSYKFVHSVLILLS